MVRSKLFICAAAVVLSISILASAATRTTTIYVDGMRRLRHLD